MATDGAIVESWIWLFPFAKLLDADNPSHWRNEFHRLDFRDERGLDKTWIRKGKSKTTRDAVLDRHGSIRR